MTFVAPHKACAQIKQFQSVTLFYVCISQVLFIWGHGEYSEQNGVKQSAKQNPGVWRNCSLAAAVPSWIHHRGKGRGRNEGMLTCWHFVTLYSLDSLCQMYASISGKRNHEDLLDLWLKVKGLEKVLHSLSHGLLISVFTWVHGFTWVITIFILWTVLLYF